MEKPIALLKSLTLLASLVASSAHAASGVPAPTGSPKPAAAVSPAPGAIDDDEQVIQVQTDLKQLIIQVRDGKSGISGLGAQDFEIVDEGVVRPVDVFQEGGAPVYFTFVVDHSSSVAAYASQVEAQAKRLTSLLGPNDRVRVYNFSSSYWADFFSPRDTMARQLRESTTGSSAINDSLDGAVRYFVEPLGEYPNFVFVLSDGCDEELLSGHDRSNVPYSQVQSTIGRARDAEFYFLTTSRTSGWGCESQGLQRMAELARASGGKHYLLDDWLRKGMSVTQIIGSVMQESRGFYRLGYYLEEGVSSGKERKVEVRLKSRGGKVRMVHRGAYKPLQVDSEKLKRAVSERRPLDALPLSALTVKSALRLVRDTNIYNHFIEAWSRGLNEPKSRWRKQPGCDLKFDRATEGKRQWKAGEELLVSESYASKSVLHARLLGPNGETATLSCSFLSWKPEAVSENVTLGTIQELLRGFFEIRPNYRAPQLSTFRTQLPGELQ